MIYDRARAALYIAEAVHLAARAAACPDPQVKSALGTLAGELLATGERWMPPADDAPSSFVRYVVRSLLPDGTTHRISSCAERTDAEELARRVAEDHPTWKVEVSPCPCS